MCMERKDSKISIGRPILSPAQNSPAQNTGVTVPGKRHKRNAANTLGRPAFKRNMLATAILLAFAPLAQAAPIGGQVVSGTGSITQAGTTTSIQQSSQNLSLNWQSFNIASQETVNFLQPSSSAIAVNHILDNNGTQILGNLNANGQVYLINPNGILFGQGAQVNVGGLVASTLDFNDASLNGTTRTFSGAGTGSVVNQGTINAASGGYVALLGNTVSNQGTITALLGTVALGAGSAATLTFSGNTLVHIQVDQNTLDNLVENKALIQADGGLVIMTAGAKDALLASAVNNTGVIEARTVQNINGTITLQGGMTAGTANVGGTLDASAPNGGNGGFIETSAAHVNVAPDAQVTTASSMGLTGSWLIDPVDFTIAASGGDITGANLDGYLASNSVTISTVGGSVSCINATCGAGTAGSGNINVNDPLSWSGSNTLTLTADNNININSSITAASGGLTLSAVNGITAPAAAVNVGTFILSGGNWFQNAASLPAFAATDFRITGGTFLRVQGGDGSSGNPYQLTDIYGVQGMNGNLAASYVLNNNINASITSGWNAGAGFKPIGQAAFDPVNYNITDLCISCFTGTFDGKTFTISGLKINHPLSTDPLAWGVGLFGVTKSGSSISNVNMSNVSITGFYAVGGLVGANYGTVSNSYTTAGTVTGDDSVGGLVGFNYGGTNTNGGTVTNSHATANVNGIYGNIGGLVGFNYGVVSNSYATGIVSGIGTAGNQDNKRIGGLVGANYFVVNGGGIISNSYATGAVIGGIESYDVGGLVGRNKFGTIASSYATGAVSGAGFNISPGGQGVGGLVGYSYGTAGLISNSYATGNVTGTTSSGNIGGLVGKNAATIQNSYATGIVSGGAYAGGLVGLNSTIVISPTSTYYGIISNSYATGTVGGTTDVGGLVGLNDSGSTISNSYATGAVSVGTNAGGLAGVNGGTVNNSFWNITTSGKATSAGGTGMTTADMQTQANFTTATPANGNVNPGWDFATTWVMYDGYTYPLLRSFMTPLTVTANNASKTYDGLAAATATGVTYSSTPNSNLLGTFNWGGATNAGIYLPSAKSGLYSNQQGYIISYSGGTLTINPKVVTLTGSKIYDGTATFTGGTNLSVITGVGTQTLLLTGTASTANKNVGNNINLLNGGTLALANGTGGLATNYTLTGVGLTGVVAITPLALTGASIAAASSIYGATVIPGAVSFGNVISGDVVTSTASIVSPVNSTSGHLNFGNYQQIATTLGGADAGNYSFAGFTTPTANYTVSKLALAGAAIAASSSTYGDVLTPGAASFTNVLSGDTVTDTASVNTTTLSGAGKPIVGSYTQTTGAISGTDAGNYSLTPFTTATSNYTITPLALTGAAIAASSSTYGDVLTPGAASFTNVLSGDTVTDTASVNTTTLSGAGKPIVGSYTQTTGAISGTDAGNYSFAGFTTPTANYTVSKLALTGAAIAASSSTYGDVLTPGAASFTNVLSGDTVTDTASVNTTTLSGAGKPIVGSYTQTTGAISGTDAGNYSFAGFTTPTANYTVSKLALAGAAIAASSSTYGDVLTPGAVSFTNVLSGDTVTDTASLPANLSSSSHLNAGTYTQTTGAISGIDAGNYSLTPFTTATSNYTVNQLGITVSGITVNTKTYDGTTNAILNLGSVSFGGIVSGDTVSISSGSISGSFASKDVGNNIAVNLSGVTLTGTDSGNYTQNGVTGVTGNITPAPLTVTGTTVVNNKVYDGTTAATLTGGTLSGTVFGGDNVTLTQAGTFASQNVGNGIAVTASDSVGGSSAGNYTILVQPTGLSGNITPATLTVTGLSGTNRVYDGSLIDALSGTASLSGLVTGETLTLGGTSSGTLASANAGSEGVTTAVTIADGTGLASNYILTQPTLANVTISPAPLTVTGLSGTDRVFNGTTVDALTGTAVLNGLVGSETLTLGGTSSGTLASANAGSEGVTTAVTIAGGTGLASNYILTQPTLAPVRILPLVEPAQSTSQSINTGSTIAVSLPSQIAEIDSQQFQAKTRYTGSEEMPGVIAEQWGSGNGPAITMIDGGVRMPDDRRDRQ